MEQSKRTPPEVLRSSQILNTLQTIESGLSVPHLIMGGVGVAGVIGHAIRPFDDLDICVDSSNATTTVSYLQTIGFTPDTENTARLGGSGIVLRKGELIIDVVLGEFSPDALILRPFGGQLIIPRAALDYPGHIGDITFQTISPEAHYFLKNRAVSRHPLHTINPVQKRAKDRIDYNALKGIINIQKAQSLLTEGFVYKGKHPLFAIAAAKIKALFPHKQS